MKSPFRYGCVVSGKDFCARPELERRLADAIESGARVAVTGPRRTGKSSLVLETVRRLKGVSLFHVDFLGVKSRAEICKRMVAALARLEDSDTWRAKLLGALLRLRPSLSIDPSNGAPTITVDAREAASPDGLDFVMDALAAQTARRKVCAVFDEFQDVYAIDDANGALAVMRSRIQLDSGTAYVFLGSVRHKMLDMFLDRASPFYHGAAMLEVGSIEPDAFYAFLRKAFADGGRDFPRETFEAVSKAAGGTPGFIQEICDALWQESAAGDTLGEPLLASVLDRLFEREGEHFAFAIRPLTAFQLQVLSAVALHGGKETSSAAFLEACSSRSASAVRKALARLIDCELVFYDAQAREYAIDNPLFAQWLRRRP